MGSTLMFAITMLAVTGSPARPKIQMVPTYVALSPSTAVRMMVISYHQPMTAEDITEAMAPVDWLPANEDELRVFSIVRIMPQVVVAGVIRKDGKVPVLESGAEGKISGKLATTCWPAGTMFLMVRRETKKEEK